MALPPVGTIIRHTYRGELEYGRVTPGNCWTPVPHVPRGTQVVCGVWKREVFHARKTITMRKDWNDRPCPYPAGPPDPVAEAAARNRAESVMNLFLRDLLHHP